MATGRLRRSRLRTLEQQMHLTGPPLGRLLFLIPELWPEEDHAVFENPPSLEALSELVERRTGLRPTFDMEPPIWAITVPVPEEILALDEVEKAAFLEQHESRPIPPWQREWRAVADDADGDGR